MWHFNRICSGPLKGAWIHPFFVKSSRKMCTYMSRHVPSGELLYDLDPLPLRGPTTAVAVPQQHQPKPAMVSIRDMLEHTSTEVFVSDPVHSIGWSNNATIHPAQPSNISARPTQVESSMARSMDMAQFPMDVSILEPTPILENHMSSTNNYNQQMGLDYQYNNQTIRTNTYPRTTESQWPESFEDLSFLREFNPN